jgi:ACS family pantothenate transporter-like MFS transporter
MDMSTKDDVKRPESATQSPLRSSTSGEEVRATDLVKEQPKANWKSYLWDTFNKSPEERRFLFKLDAVLLTFASLGYFIKYLDQININNAFVSGMKEDLGLFGNELNYMQTCWTVGYVLGEIPR